jgi:serine protease AprX
MAKRYKIRFRDQESYMAAQHFTATADGGVRPRSAHEFGRSLVQVRNDRRRYISVEPSTQLAEGAGERLLGQQLESFDRHFGAEIVEDFRYDPETDIFDTSAFGPDDPNDPSLDDVLTMIEAREAWQESTGVGVTIAVIDTGVDGTRPEFPQSKRAGQWQPLNDTPWTDWKGHGTMCAAIAAGTRAQGGAYDGVAPSASLIACKTGFFDSELAAIYDYLIDLGRTQNLNIIATNSFGVQTGTPPPVPDDSDFIPALEDALAAGVKVLFSAGNYHTDAGGQSDRCEPTSIWLHKCRADVMAVATCDLERRMWYYSSRGPGQHFGDANTNQKPDVTAPTPEHGRVVYGGGIRSLPKGWGTSGACPQVAGLAALLLAKKNDLSREQLFDAIRRSTTPLGYGATCAGSGLINCKRAIDSI